MFALTRLSKYNLVLFEKLIILGRVQTSSSLVLFRPRRIKSIYTLSISLWSILILYSHLHMGLPFGHSPSSFPTETLYIQFSIYSTCSINLFLLHLITWRSINYEAPHFAVSSSLLISPILDPNTILALWSRSYSRFRYSQQHPILMHLPPVFLLIKICSSTQCIQTRPLVCVLPSGW
jgi:hypothetical protein